MQDPRLKGVDHLTLSYTFFKVDEEVERDDAGQEGIVGEDRTQAAVMVQGS